ncbi:hypothetical protein P8907_19880 [Bacillus atrophaeus]|uniref:hypothetical protein n=1 Tax=Bacillus atrophaeus TaxID=1452 RepID=UPI002282E4B8|nr:hypothetical protein [Bacillus atrophaeus]MCY8911057.1 hypothetical protein [Bacillus atrophaeus]MEC0836360.1 hypothetical protein [Bacillus atrophaeus]MEC0846590.1 hypothetical protein [Bacillus atrophaeus]MEC0850888.1 hypothetical protein [Bacillus atrophaeus]MEC0867634.1 hypothetical protein [Bacillus atrophaeus]
MKTYNTYLLRSYNRQNKLLTQGLSSNYVNSLPGFLRRVKERYPEVDTVECTVILNYEDSFRTEYVDIFTLWKAEDEVLAAV